MDNNFHQTHAIFELFEGFEMENMDDPASTDPFVNGMHSGTGSVTNAHQKTETNRLINGVSKESPD